MRKPNYFFVDFFFHILFLFAVSFSILLFLSSCDNSLSDHIVTISVEGTVTDATNGSPIESALVELSYIYSWTDIITCETTRTNIEGRYNLEYTGKHQPSGWILDASAAGYIPSFVGIFYTGNIQTVDFQLSPNPED